VIGVLPIMGGHTLREALEDSPHGGVVDHGP
jgi:hypothetical protein